MLTYRLLVVNHCNVVCTLNYTVPVDCTLTQDETLRRACLHAIDHGNTILRVEQVTEQGSTFRLFSPEFLRQP